MRGRAKRPPHERYGIPPPTLSSSSSNEDAELANKPRRKAPPCPPPLLMEGGQTGMKMRLSEEVLGTLKNGGDYEEDDDWRYLLPDGWSCPINNLACVVSAGKIF
mmetsp:Transcript_5640/g.7469  ORF Transcript_5640/g.7469 Transcript_5640/m.7469 type:complete len:105 (+) Transcript_5640:47-361(+)